MQTVGKETIKVSDKGGGKYIYCIYPSIFNFVFFLVRTTFSDKDAALIYQGFIFLSLTDTA